MDEQDIQKTALYANYAKKLASIGMAGSKALNSTAGQQAFGTMGKGASGLLAAYSAYRIAQGQGNVGDYVSVGSQAAKLAGVGGKLMPALGAGISLYNLAKDGKVDMNSFVSTAQSTASAAGQLTGSTAASTLGGALAPAAAGIAVPNLLNAIHKDSTENIGHNATFGLVKKSGQADVAGRVGTGAAAGAAVGSVVPVVGTLVGGMIGAVGGALSKAFGGGKTYHPKAIEMASEDYRAFQKGKQSEMFGNMHLDPGAAYTMKDMYEKGALSKDSSFDEYARAWMKARPYIKDMNQKWVHQYDNTKALNYGLVDQINAG